MARISTLPRENLGEFEDTFKRLEEASGFVPNSLYIMAHRPGLLRAFIPLAFEVLGAPSSLPQGLRNLIAHVASRTAGCQYCAAHTAESSSRMGIEDQKIAAAFEYETSPLFSEAERAALGLAQAAASVPNMTSDQDFDILKAHYSEEQIVEIVGVISLFGFLNRWNDTLATDLEDHPIELAERVIGSTGWSVGKHGG